MPRTVTVTLDDGSQHVYANVPDNVQPAQIEQRASVQFGKKVKAIDGGNAGAADVPLESDKPGVVEKVLSAIPSGEQVGGAVVDTLSQDALGSKLPPEARAAAGYVANVGYDAATLGAGAVAGARMGAQLARKGAEKLVYSSLKPAIKAHEKGDAARAVGTILDEGFNTTAGGVQKMRSGVDALDEQITDLLKGSGATVDKGVVASRIADVIKNVEKYNPTPQDSTAAVERVYDQFMANRLIPKNIPVEQANDLKVGIHRMLREKYGELGSDAVEAQKALGRGFREEIASAVPGVSEALSKQGDLINALNITERRVMQSLNNNPGGLALLERSPKMFAAFMADKSMLFKSIVARMLNANQRILPGAIGAGTTQGVKEYMEQPR